MQAPSKRLILCFDGTWNAIADPNIVTNVVKIANSVGLQDPSGVNQICYYNSGVGSGGPIDRFMGGVFGAGLKSNVKRAIAFLALNYRTNDEIYLFGFSRGAYTARAVAGVLGVAGIPKEIRDAEVHWERYRQMAKLQSKQRDLRQDSKKYIKLQKQIDDLKGTKDRPTNYEPGEINITCVGVFDTVGSYGVPAGFGLSGLPHLFTYWTRGFHSRKFGSQVRVGLHAMAIDEMRKPFSPTFWMRKPDELLDDKQVVEQMWFPGVHSNVGGGYDNSGLSDLALAWMISRVQQNTGLYFEEDEILKHVWPCTAGTLYVSSKGGWFAKARSILPVVAAAASGATGKAGAQPVDPKLRVRVNEAVHWSVQDRCGLDATPVDGVGSQKYAPGNFNLKTGKFSEPSALERKLCDPHRAWREDKCPRMKINKPCECKLQPPVAMRDKGQGASPT